jgi:hypothetical protein
MKTTPFLMAKWALRHVVLGVIGMTVQVMAQPVQVEAEIVNLKGEVRCCTSNVGIWRPAKVGDLLKPGTVIQTGTENSSVDLLLGTESSVAPQPISSTGAIAQSASRPEFFKASVVRVLENSLLGITTLTIQTNGVERIQDIELDLRAGKIIGDVTQLSVASKYEIKIPNGVVGVRGSPIMYVVTAEGVVKAFESSYLLPWAGDVGKSGMVLAYQDRSGNITTMVVRPDGAAKRFGPIPSEFFSE